MIYGVLKILCIGLSACLLYADNPTYNESAAQSADTVLVSSNSQMFIDDYIIEISQGYSKKLIQAKLADDPVLVPEYEWEYQEQTSSGIYLYGNVLKDDGKLKMWYRAYSTPAEDYNYPSKICYAEYDSLVGKWTKPNLNLVAYNGSVENNIVKFDSEAKHIEIASVVKTKETEFQMLAYEQTTNSYNSYVSNDGYSWQILSQSAVNNDSIPFSDVCTMAFDEREKQFIAVFKKPATGYARNQYISSSDNLLSFPDGHRIELVSSEDDLIQVDGQQIDHAESYGMGILPYNGVYLGFNWLFAITQDNDGGTDDGPIFTQLMFSRDLRIWTKPFIDPIIENGDNGSWNDGMITTASYPIVIGDKILMYYGGWDGDHNPTDDQNNFRIAQIGVAEWEVDRFVGLESGDTESILETKPLIFEGNRLSVNMTGVHEDSEMYVEILDLEGNPYESYTKSLSLNITGDHLRKEVSWNQADVSELEGKPVKLRFYSKHTTFFSFQFLKKELPLAIENHTEEKEFVYPNPISSILNISLDLLPEKSNLTLYSLDGRIALNAKVSPSDNTLNVSNLEKGIYIVTLRNSKYSVFQKVFIQ